MLGGVNLPTCLLLWAPIFQVCLNLTCVLVVVRMPLMYRRMFMVQVLGWKLPRVLTWLLTTEKLLKLLKVKLMSQQLSVFRAFCGQLSVLTLKF